MIGKRLIKMKFNFKIFIFCLLISSNTNVIGMSLCEQELKKFSKEDIQEINNYFIDINSDWILAKPYCHLTADKRDVLVYEYWLNPKLKKIKNVKTNARYAILNTKEEKRAQTCIDEWSSKAIKFFDIEYKYNYDYKQKIVSLRFNIDDCRTQEAARQAVDWQNIKKSDMNRKQQKDAADALKFYRN